MDHSIGNDLCPFSLSNSSANLHICFDPQRDTNTIWANMDNMVVQEIAASIKKYQECGVKQ